MDNKYIEVGKIVNTRGIGGEVKIVSWCDYPEDFEQFDTVYIKENNEYREFIVESVKYVKSNVILKLENISKIEQAEKLIDKLVFTLREYFDNLDEDTFFIQDLIGHRVILEDGTPFGILTDIFQTGSNDVYCVKSEQYGEVLLPGIKDVIRKIDMEQKTVTIHLIEGLV